MSFGGSFGNASGQSSFNSQSSGPFGQSSVFGSIPTPSGFGSASGPSLFNTTPTTPQNTGGSLFGGNTGGSLFGSFGQQSQSFGGGNSVQSFRGGASFGLGASCSTDSPDGSQGTFGKAFNRVPEVTDQGSRDAEKAFLMNISMMPEFVGCQPEMLRACDYKKGHKRRSGQIQTPNTVTAMFGGASGFAMSGGSGGTSSYAFGSGGGFSATSQFGGTTTSGIFGHSTSQPSPGFGASFGSGTSFAQPTGSSGPFAGSFGNTGGSIFSSTTTASAGFGQTNAPSMFGLQQSGQSAFGGQTAPSFSSSFGQPTGAGIFGQTSGGSVFAFSNPSVFPAVGATPLFGPGTTPGSLFTGATTTSNIFGSQTSGSSLFPQPTSTGNIFGSFGQSTPFIFGPQTSQGQQFGFTGNTGQQIPGQSLFAPPTSTPPIQPPPGGLFAQTTMFDNPSTNPNWTPEYGLVVPDTTELSRLRSDKPVILDSMVNSYEYMRKDREKIFANHFASIPVRFVLDEEPVPMEDKEQIDMSWGSFEFSGPVKKSLTDEIQQTLEEIKSRRGVPEVPATAAETRPESEFSFPTPGNTAHKSSPAETAPVDQTEPGAAENRAVVELSQEDLQDLLPVISQNDYYIAPTMETLKELVTVKGKTALKSVLRVEIGRTGYGKISFEAPINLERMKVNEEIAIKRGRVENISSSFVFRGIPAVVSFEKIFRIGRSKSGFLATGAELQEEIEEFKRISSYMGTEFQSYDRHGTWVFKVDRVNLITPA